MHEDVQAVHAARFSKFNESLGCTDANPSIWKHWGHSYGVQTQETIMEYMIEFGFSVVVLKGTCSI